MKDGLLDTRIVFLLSVPSHAATVNSVPQFSFTCKDFANSYFPDLMINVVAMTAASCFIFLCTRSVKKIRSDHRAIAP